MKKGKTERSKPETVCQQWVEYAYQAVEDWDGVSNMDLIAMLVDRLGMTPDELVEIAAFIKDGPHEEPDE